MNGFMFDTNIFNHLLDGEIDPEALPKVPIFSTFEQFDELQNTEKVDRREKLLSFFKICDPSETMVTTFVLGNARLDKTQLGDGVLYQRILNNLNSRKKKDNNFIDALIAETSYLNGLTLVTEDRHLKKACLELEIPVISKSQFLELKNPH